MCGISRCWLDSMIISEVCFSLATIKGHSKMCSFTVLGGGGALQCTQCNTSPRIELIRLLIVACGMLFHSSSMAVWSCWTLAGTGTHCRIRRSRASKHAQWVTCPVSMLAIQELGCFRLLGIVYDPCNMGPCIFMLQHEVMIVDEWHSNVQWKPGFIREENNSPKCQTPSNVSICPLKAVTMTNCSQVETPMRMTSMQEELPWDGFWQFVQKFFGYANQLLQQLSGWLVSDDRGGEDAGCGGLGWCGYTWSAIVRPVYVLINSLKRLWRRMVEKWH